jgi:hypothetical protein
MHQLPISPSVAVGRIVESLSRLAWPAAEQREYLSATKLPVDEPALDHEHALTTLWVVEETGLLGKDVPAGLRAIDAILDDMSGAENEVLWTPRALSKNESRAEVRGESGEESAHCPRSGLGMGQGGLQEEGAGAEEGGVAAGPGRGDFQVAGGKGQAAFRRPRGCRRRRPRRG